MTPRLGDFVRYRNGTTAPVMVAIVAAVHENSLLSLNVFTPKSGVVVAEYVGPSIAEGTRGWFVPVVAS